MSRSIFGWDLPPGCSVNDIPGNRPEDEEWEIRMNDFFDKKRIFNLGRCGVTISEKEYNLMDKLYDTKKWSDVVDKYIILAIEYGIELGMKAQQELDKEARFYEEQYKLVEENTNRVENKINEEDLNDQS